MRKEVLFQLRCSVTKTIIGHTTIRRWYLGGAKPSRVRYRNLRANVKWAGRDVHKYINVAGAAVYTIGIKSVPGKRDAVPKTCWITSGTRGFVGMMTWGWIGWWNVVCGVVFRCNACIMHNARDIIEPYLSLAWADYAWFSFKYTVEH